MAKRNMRLEIGGPVSPAQRSPPPIDNEGTWWALAFSAMLPDLTYA
jgi:hypothetical protein